MVFQEDHLRYIWLTIKDFSLEEVMVQIMNMSGAAGVKPHLYHLLVIPNKEILGYLFDKK